MRYSPLTQPATLKISRPANDHDDENTPDEILLDFDVSRGTLRVRKDELDVQVPAGTSSPTIDGGNF